MPALKPIKRRELIAGLHALGFDGPKSGGRHQFMTRGAVRVILPNPHQEDVGRDLLRRILAQAGIERNTWEAL